MHADQLCPLRSAADLVFEEVLRLRNETKRLKVAGESLFSGVLLFADRLPMRLYPLDTLATV